MQMGTGEGKRVCIFTKIQGSEKKQDVKSHDEVAQSVRPSSDTPGLLVQSPSEHIQEATYECIN